MGLRSDGSLARCLEWIFRPLRRLLNPWLAATIYPRTLSARWSLSPGFLKSRKRFCRWISRRWRRPPPSSGRSTWRAALAQGWGIRRFRSLCPGSCPCRNLDQRVEWCKYKCNYKITPVFILHSTSKDGFFFCSLLLSLSNRVFFSALLLFFLSSC